MKTAHEIYTRSLALLGQKNGANTQDFEERAPSLINCLIAELSELDLAMKGKEPFDQASVFQIHSLEEEVGMEDAITLSLLPMGLAALLIQEEEPDRALFFRNLYQQEREMLRHTFRRGKRHKIRRSI